MAAVAHPLLFAQASTPLQSLNLGDNELGTQALVEIVHVMRTNTTLQSLSLENPRLFSFEVRSVSVRRCVWFFFLGIPLLCLVLGFVLFR